MFYTDASGQLYLHLPLFPTLIVVAVIFTLLILRILMIGLFRGSDQVAEDDRQESEFELPPTQIRRLDL